MKSVRSSVLLSAALLASTSLSALASGLTASSAAGGSSASSASMGSVENSSNSAAKALTEINGPYRVVEMTPMPDRPGTLRVTLQALDTAQGDERVAIHMPIKALERGDISTGKTVLAHQRPYGVEFASGETRQAFFLLLADDWHKELSSRPVTL